MVLNENFTLTNGVEIPKIGYGTWMINNKDVVPAVKEAIKLGYRHIDTAQAYRNENGVGIGIKECGVKREELFVTTKLGAGIKSYEKAVSSIDKSLEELQVDYIDLMIIHSPQPWTQFGGQERYFEGNREAWKALEEAYDAGKLRAIGVSNFQIVDLENILSSCKVKPMVNQILTHISNTPLELIEYCQDNDILVEAYSPIAHGALLKDKQVSQMAKKYEVSIAQLCIRYTLQLDLLPLPKTVNPEHMKSNVEVDFEISNEDMEVLKNVEQIKDYGRLGIFPVFGGKISLKSIFSSIFGSKRKKD